MQMSPGSEYFCGGEGGRGRFWRGTGLVYNFWTIVMLELSIAAMDVDVVAWLTAVQN